MKSPYKMHFKMSSSEVSQFLKKLQGLSEVPEYSYDDVKEKLTIKPPVDNPKESRNKIRNLAYGAMESKVKIKSPKEESFKSGIKPKKEKKVF